MPWNNSEVRLSTFKQHRQRRAGRVAQEAHRDGVMWWMHARRWASRVNSSQKWKAKGFLPSRSPASRSRFLLVLLSHFDMDGGISINVKLRSGETVERRDRNALRIVASLLFSRLNWLSGRQPRERDMTGWIQRAG